MRAEDAGSPTFDGKFINYPYFKKEWCSYRSTYQDIVGDNLVANNLKEKCWASVRCGN